METLYNYIKKESFVLDKTMHEIAKDLNVSYTTLYNMRFRAPSRTTYHKLSNYFDKDIRELLDLPIK